MTEIEFLLEMNNISKEFPGVKALDDVTLKVRPGTVHALMGENGAGKSTLMKCLFGIYQQDAGEIILNQQTFNLWIIKKCILILLLYFNNWKLILTLMRWLKPYLYRRYSLLKLLKLYPLIRKLS
ncbi:MAG: Monosaccharide-transporting ATPase [Firmicutes bacterium]|nr:Monosaccharide-transporting ATPase [Bacillota bacterium]